MGCAVSHRTKKRLSGGLDHVKSQIPQWGKEADRMHEAVQKTDEVSIVRVLARFTNKQRTKLMKTYKEKFDEDLQRVLKSKLSEETKEVVSALLCSPVNYEVQSLHKAFEQQDYETVVTIITSTKSMLLVDIQEQYSTDFNKTIEDELQRIRDNDLKHVLISLLNVDRPFTNKKADKLAAKERARSLYNSGDILALLCEPLSRNQLKETLNAFLSLYRVNINQFIDEKSSSLSIQAKEAMKGFVLHAENPALYFAKKIKHANQTQILKTIISRSEIDLYYINKEYLRWYSRQLHDAVYKQCSSKYARLLTVILDYRGQYSESARKR